MLLITFGIIPTRVGTRFTKKVGANCGNYHPHACGDKIHFLRLMYSVRGSSPRVWGQVLILAIRFTHCGIIPTRVGTR